jgi:hypothetical protein
MTQIQIPKNLKGVRIDIQASGQQSFGFAAAVDPTQSSGAYALVTLPSTLGILHGTSSGLITITVTGFAELPPGWDDTTLPISQAVDGGVTQYAQGIKILRRTRAPFVDGRILFLPMPLRYSCWDTEQCSTSQTCTAGKCVDLPTVDPNTLAEYSDAILDGRSNTCFKPSTCFADLLQAQLVDSTNCTYRHLIPPPLSRSGLNVKVYYEAGEEEILDYGAAEGFTRVAASVDAGTTNGPEFTLAPGLCTFVKNYNLGLPGRRIHSVRSATVCPPKDVAQPICADEAPKPVVDAGSTNCTVEYDLTPSKSALYVLVDRANSMRSAFGPNGLSQVLGFSLQDPAVRTTSMAFKLLPLNPATCTNPSSFTTFSSTTDVPFGLTAVAQPAIAGIVGDATNVLTTSPSLYLDGALDSSGAYKALRDFKATSGGSFNRVALLIVTNRAADDTCVPAKNAVTEAAAAFSSTDRIHTYVVLLKNQDQTADATAAAAIATSGGTSLLDGRNGDAEGADAFNRLVADLGSCLYERPAEMLPAVTTLRYFDLAQAKTVEIAFNNTCSASTQDTSAGWNFDGQHVRICGSACTGLRDALRSSANAAAALTLNEGRPAAPNVPVTFTQPCGL